MHFARLIFTLLLSLTAVVKAQPQPLAFPGAEGCGCFASGGRGGEIVYVTNLNDSGPGSLRYALTECPSPKIIMFTLSGNILLKSKMEVREGNFTIAGQSAPGNGICVAGSGIDIEADNVIIRYIRIRPGDINGDEIDALTIKRSKNVIVDHCSFSWGTDETCSCYDNTNFTLQWCIISESLNSSVHRKGEHGYGGIWGGMNATFHHNLLAHHKSRNPRLHGSRYHHLPELERAELINNVVYNWHSKCIYGGESGNYVITGNYYIPGPATQKSAINEILEPWEPFSYYYFADNHISGNEYATLNNKSLIAPRVSMPEKFILQKPFSISNFAGETAEQAYLNILKNSGASINKDTVDKRIVYEVLNKSYTFGINGIINSQNDVKGWPELKGRTTQQDKDKDGMPDSWETSMGLDPMNPEDGKLYKTGSCFTNIELYLNELCNQ